PGYIRVDTLIVHDQQDQPAPAENAPALYLTLDEIIINNLADLFPGMHIVETLPFRVTRNAAVELDDDEIDDLLEHVEEELRARRFADPIRIETAPKPSPRILNFLLVELGLSAQDHSINKLPLAYADLFTIADIDCPNLKDTPWKPIRPSALSDPEADIFAQIRSADILVHHPYESFTDSVERFITAAAHDPDVLAIKQTLYRTSRNSPFIKSLVHAAEEGKQVACLVELRARFDEEKNVQFARQLEAAGVHVAYGVLGLKTHSKCSMVVRREKINGSWGIRTYAHLGTGNYHPQTAHLYTDLGLLTCDPEITADVVRLFNKITGLTAGQSYNQLLVAPDHMRTRFIEMIDTEITNAKAGKPARIIAKMNALEDRATTQALYHASNAGVQIELIIRGFCCLRPGIKAMSENITVRSIIGRFLEHSRLFVFANGSADPLDYSYYFGSADWMSRNLSSRVEAACPVHAPDAKAKLWRLLSVLIDDRRNASILNPDGSYTHLATNKDTDPTSPAALGTFQTLMNDAHPPITD
ncbi:MAG: polyphosphate kinase 1, partial [Phycisphaerales bacterium]|nr:polyphosphate kinase 1 [Phycisphaerales bacterium]